MSKALRNHVARAQQHATNAPQPPVVCVCAHIRATWVAAPHQQTIGCRGLLNGKYGAAMSCPQCHSTRACCRSCCRSTHTRVLTRPPAVAVPLHVPNGPATPILKKRGRPGRGWRRERVQAREQWFTQNLDRASLSKLAAPILFEPFLSNNIGRRVV